MYVAKVSEHCHRKKKKGFARNVCMLFDIDEEMIYETEQRIREYTSLYNL